MSVLRTHRKLGIATKLMQATHYQMQRVYGCKICSLRVRVTNRAAYTLYKDVLGYEVHDVDKEYYADKEDAYDMRVTFEGLKEPTDAEEKETKIMEKESDKGGNINLVEEVSTAGKNAEKNRKKREKQKAKKAQQQLDENQQEKEKK